MDKIKDIVKNAKGMLLDGIIASSQIDKSAEVLDIKGCDISDVDNGTVLVNWEHRSDSPSDIIGKVLYAQKIFKEDDCKTDRQIEYWKKSGVPYIYGIIELFDQEKHPQAMAVASMVRYNVDRNQPINTKYSIEGSTVDRKGNKLLQSIFKRLAITCAPCNADATSYLLSDPLHPKQSQKDDLKSIADKIGKFEDPSSTSLGGSVETEGMPLLFDPVSKSEAKLPKIKEVLKSWDGQSELKSFIKHHLPEVSDEFIDRFKDAIDGYKIKAKIKKFEGLHGLLTSLVKAEGQGQEIPQKHEIEFAGKKIKTGLGSVYDQQGNHEPYSILHHDPVKKEFTIAPYKKEAVWGPEELKTVKMDQPNFRLDSFPEEIETPAIVNSEVHGHLLTPDAKELVNGMILDPKNNLQIKHSGNSSVQAHWAKNPAGKLVFVKPSTLDPQENQGFEEAERETAFHNLAKNFFGLGKYVPTVGTVRHPKTGQLTTIIEGIPGKHWEGGQDQVNTIKSLGDSGELDKLNIMDDLLGNYDRHKLNYLTTPDNSLKLIDHGFSFEPYVKEPHYMTQYNQIHQLFNGQSAKEKPLSENVVKWIDSLNPVELKRQLRKNGVPLAYATQASERLRLLKEKLALNPLTPRKDIHGEKIIPIAHESEQTGAA